MKYARKKLGTSIKSICRGLETTLRSISGGLETTVTERKGLLGPTDVLNAQLIITILLHQGSTGTDFRADIGN